MKKLLLTTIACAGALYAPAAQAADVFLQFTVNTTGAHFDYVLCPPPAGSPGPGYTCEKSTPFNPTFSYAQIFSFSNGVSTYHSGYPTLPQGEVTFTVTDLGATLFRVDDFLYSRTSNVSASGYVPGGFRESATASSFVVSSVPEPAAWAMMIAGFALVGGALRRRVHVAFA